MNNIDDSMFASIRQSLKEKKTTIGSGFKDILKFEPKADGKPNTYVVRILPSIKDPSNTFFEYVSYSWDSLSTGRWLKVISPTTFGERCPIQEEKSRAFNSKLSTNEDKEKARILKRKVSWLMNVYVIDDPVNPKNNGTVKMVDMGKQLHDKIMKAYGIEDGNGNVDPDAIGDDIFLKPNTSMGYNLKIIVKKDKAFQDYNDSDFARKADYIPGIDDDKEKIDEILKSTFDLKTINPVKSYDEIVDILNEHYFVDCDKIVSSMKDTNSSNTKEHNTITEDADTFPYNQTVPEVGSLENATSIDDVDESFINDILNGN